MSAPRDTAGNEGGRRSYVAAALGDTCYPLADRVLGDETRVTASVEAALAQARMRTPADHYLATALGVGLLGGLVWGLLGTGVGYALFATGASAVLPGGEQLAASTLFGATGSTLLFGLLSGTIGFALGTAALLARPYRRARRRKREIDLLLADSISFLYALSTGSLDHLELVEAIADAEDAYGAVAAEFRTILLETRYTDADYRTAIANRAAVTPSEEFSQFLTDLLSTIDSGGDVERFLADETERYSRTARQRQERILDSLNLVGEMYLTISLFPLFLLVIFVVVQLIPSTDVQTELLYLAVYGLTPLVGLAFLVLVSTVTPDEPGDGFLCRDTEPESPVRGWRRRLHTSYTGRPRPETDLFDHIRNRERRYRRRQLLRWPHRFVLDRPLFTLAVTVPASIALVAFSVRLGVAPRSFSALLAEPVRGTTVYLYAPLYLVAVPLALVYEWNRRRRNAITAALSATLRKLSSANETGLTFLDSLRAVSETRTGALARELELVTTKVEYGTALRPALVEFANTYRTPRLARTVRLLGHAQEASNNLSAVLRAAARTSERHDALERERVARAQTQIVVVCLTFVTALVVFAILQTQFLETMAELDLSPTSGGAGSATAGPTIDVDRLSLLFFHTLTLQAFVSGLVCGYLRDGRLSSGLKYVLAFATIALVTWSLIS